MVVGFKNKAKIKTVANIRQQARKIERCNG